VLGVKHARNEAMKTNFFKNLKIWLIVEVTPLFIILFLFAQITNAEVMSSSNYKMGTDSINFGGVRSSSGSYIVEDTAGEIATGDSSSATFAIKAGYQQDSTVNITVVPASNVTMSPSIPGLTGGTSNGQTTILVTTDNPAGYSANISAEASPALNNLYASFADYTPSGADPDYTFSNSSTASSFAFTPEGGDISSRYKNSGATCAIGSSDTSNACWDGLSTSNKTIAVRNSPNTPFGTVTTIKFRAESGSSHVQQDGIYTATTTITVLSL
jgi:hypothetical protein